MGYFQAVDPEKPENRPHYLKQYLITGLITGFDTDDLDLVGSAEAIYRRNSEFLLANLEDTDGTLLLILLLTYYLAVHDIQTAKSLFKQIYQSKDQKPRLLYRIQFMIAHLMILFEGNEATALKLTAATYRPFLKANLPFTGPAREVMRFLLRQMKVSTQKEFDAKRAELLKKLAAYQAASETQYTFWYAPFKSWVATIRLRNRQSQL